MVKCPTRYATDRKVTGSIPGKAIVKMLRNVGGPGGSGMTFTPLWPK